MEKKQETFNKDLEELKSKQTMNNTINEIKDSLEGINSGITEAEERKASLTWETKSSTPGNAESPIQDKSKEKHAKTHINQTTKN